MIIEGRNAVSEFIKSGKSADKPLVLDTARDEGAKRLLREARDSGIKIQILPKSALDKHSQSGRHQGFIVVASDFEYCTSEELADGGELIVVLDSVTDTHNLGSIIRVCECAGAGIIIAKDRQAGVNDTVMRVSEGAANHVKIARVTNIAATIVSLQNKGYFVYGAETGGCAIYDTDLTGKTAIVIGGEDTGIRRIVREKCDKIVTIPMHGKLNSLNASVACGIAVFEVMRQRRG